MPRVVVCHSIQLRLYLGKLWQAENRSSFALEPEKLSFVGFAYQTKVRSIELRGGKLGRRRIGEAGMSADREFPRPRATWWPGERMVVEFEGEQPSGVVVVAVRKEFGR